MFFRKSRPILNRCLHYRANHDDSSSLLASGRSSGSRLTMDPMNLKNSALSTPVKLGFLQNCSSEHDGKVEG